MKCELPNNAIDKVEKCAYRFESERVHVVPEDHVPEFSQAERGIQQVFHLPTADLFVITLSHASAQDVVDFQPGRFWRADNFHHPGEFQSVESRRGPIFRFSVLKGRQIGREAGKPLQVWVAVQQADESPQSESLFQAESRGECRKSIGDKFPLMTCKFSRLFQYDFIHVCCC